MRGMDVTRGANRRGRNPRGGFAAVLLLLLALAFACAGVGCARAERYDVIVVGGEPEGVAAAVRAARNGMKTLLVEDDAELGGLMTLGGLDFIDMCNGRDGTLLTRGTFLEFYDAVGGTAFDIPTAVEVFDRMTAAEENLTVKRGARVAEPRMRGQRITGVELEETSAGAGARRVVCRADCVIDATADADVAAAAGAAYTYLGEDYGQTDGSTGVTLVFQLTGVDWAQVSAYLNGDADPNTGATDKAAWGYNAESAAYVPHDAETRLRGLNLALQEDGSVLVNGFILFGVDPLDAESKEAGIRRGRAELEYIVPELRAHFAGFSRAALSGTAEQLYVRESRHILGEYRLTLDDVLENRWFADTIAIGSYPVDVPPSAAQTAGIILGNPDRYGVPFRALVPRGIDGLLVVGRSASYTSLAAGSARVIPLGMAEGDAAGVAAAYAVEHGVSFREICADADAVAEIQSMLTAQGAYLEQWPSVDEAVEHHWAYPAVKTLRALALVAGGYRNDYQLDAPCSAETLAEIAGGLGRYHGCDVADVAGADTARGDVGRAALLAAARLLGYDGAEEAEQSRAAVAAQLRADGILPARLERVFADGTPTRADVITLMANVHSAAAEAEEIGQNQTKKGADT